MKHQNLDAEYPALLHGVAGCGKTVFLLQLLDDLIAKGEEVWFCDTKEQEILLEADEKKRARYLDRAGSKALIRRLAKEADARAVRIGRGEAPVYVLIDELFELLEDVTVTDHLASLLSIAPRVKLYIAAAMQPSPARLPSALSEAFARKILFKTPDSLLLLGDKSASDLKVGEYIVRRNA